MNKRPNETQSLSNVEDERLMAELIRREKETRHAGQNTMERYASRMDFIQKVWWFVGGIGTAAALAIIAWVNLVNRVDRQDDAIKQNRERLEKIDERFDRMRDKIETLQTKIEHKADIK